MARESRTGLDTQRPERRLPQLGRLNPTPRLGDETCRGGEGRGRAGRGNQGMQATDYAQGQLAPNVPARIQLGDGWHLWTADRNRRQNRSRARLSLGPKSAVEDEKARGAGDAHTRRTRRAMQATDPNKAVSYECPTSNGWHVTCLKKAARQETAADVAPRLTDG